MDTVEVLSSQTISKPSHQHGIFLCVISSPKTSSLSHSNIPQTNINFDHLLVDIQHFFFVLFAIHFLFFFCPGAH